MHTKKQNEQNPKVEISIGYPQVYKNTDLKKKKNPVIIYQNRRFQRMRIQEN